jgi:uncharacterized protein YjbI with pentapeptide repeats
MKITKKITNEIIFEDNSNTIKDSVINAVAEGTDLRDADLGDAYLRGANLRGANLRGANLRGADLRDADLRGADLRGAYLGGADIGGASLRGADLRGAYLRDADLRGANLRGADIGGAYLGGAYLRDAKNIPFIPLSCPSDGEFIGWKKVSNKLIRLLIPSDARRSSSTSNKCRCDKAKVLEITDLDGSNPIASIINYNHVETFYVVGEMVYPDSFDEDRWNECSHGIHFFINKQEAINY